MHVLCIIIWRLYTKIESLRANQNKLFLKSSHKNSSNERNFYRKPAVQNHCASHVTLISLSWSVPNNDSIVNSQRTDYYLIRQLTLVYQQQDRPSVLETDERHVKLLYCFMVAWQRPFPFITALQPNLPRLSQRLTYPVLSNRFQLRFLPVQTVVVPCAVCSGYCSSTEYLQSLSENPLSSVPWRCIL